MIVRKRRWHHEYEGRRFWVLPCVLAVATLVVGPVLNPSSGAVLRGTPTPPKSQSPTSLATLLPTCSYALSSTDISSAVTSLGLATNVTENASEASALSGLYQSVCLNSAVSSAVGEYGTSNASLGLSSDRTGIQYANFTIDWETPNGTSPTCTNQITYADHELSWSLDLGTGVTSGPIWWNGTAPTFSPICSTAPQLWSTQDWSGYEMHDATQALYGVTAITKPVSMVSEVSQQSNPPNVHVDSIGAAWIGLEDSLGAGGIGTNLLQTGWVYDATSPSAGWCLNFASSCDYGLWYEDFPSGAHPYSGHPTVSSGDILEPTIIQQSNPQVYLVQIYDDTTGHTYSTLYNMGVTWNPSFAAYILEAPSYSTPSVIAQIPGFQDSPVQFEDGDLCVVSLGGCTYTPYQAYSAGSSGIRQDYLNQARGATNTIEQFVYAPTYWGTYQWFPEIDWQTSQYDFCYTNNNPAGCGGGGGNLGAGCVANGTSILTPSGYVPVQTLSPGESVEEYDLSSSELVVGTVRWDNSTTVGEEIQVNGGWLNLTAIDQPVYIKNSTSGYTGWLNDPRNLTTADSIYDPVNNSWIPVTCVNLVNSVATVYDVVTSGQQDFIASGGLMFKKITSFE